MDINIDRSIISYWTDKDKRLEAAHLLDILNQAVWNSKVIVTPFLSMGMYKWYTDILNKNDIEFFVFGGFSDSERVRIAFNQIDSENIRKSTKLAVLEAIPYSKGIKLGHREVLGSLLGLGLERSVIGDIRQGDGSAFVAVAEEISEYLSENWRAVGREKIDARICSGEVNVKPITGVEKNISAASSRLDVIAAAGFGVSRTLVKDWITQGKLKRNNIEILKPDIQLAVGDIISCRGKGRIRLEEVGEKTCKGREIWKIFIYRDN